MLAPYTYTNAIPTQVNNQLTSTCAYVAQYKSTEILDSNCSTANVADLYNDDTFVRTLYQQQCLTNLIAMKERYSKIIMSFMQNGGGLLGIVGMKIFFQVGSVLMSLPFRDVLVQYSPSNSEILFDMSFKNNIEVSVGKYLDYLDGDNVMFSLSIDNEPYAISRKNINELKNVLLEMLS